MEVEQTGSSRLCEKGEAVNMSKETLAIIKRVREENSCKTSKLRGGDCGNTHTFLWQRKRMCS